MKILEIVKLLRDGHYVEFSRAAIREPSLVFSLWRLLSKESRLATTALEQLMIKNAGVPVFCIDPQLDPTVRALLVPKHEQGSVFRPGGSLWTQATSDLKECTLQAQKRSSQSAAVARDLLQLLIKGELSFDRARERLGKDEIGEPVARALLARAGTPALCVEVGTEHIEIGGGDPLSPWQDLSGLLTLTNAQALSPSRSGLAVRVMRGTDDLPHAETARDIEILLGAGACQRARVQLALATAVPVQISVRVEERIADGKRRYTMFDIALPVEIRDAIEQLAEQAELF